MLAIYTHFTLRAVRTLVSVRSAVTISESSKSGSASGKLRSQSQDVHVKSSRGWTTYLPDTFQLPRTGRGTASVAWIWVTYDRCVVGVTTHETPFQSSESTFGGAMTSKVVVPFISPVYSIDQLNRVSNSRLGTWLTRCKVFPEILALRTRYGPFTSTLGFP